MDKEQLRELRFRKERLEDCLQALEGHLSGLRASFLPLVRNEAGDFSQERTRALIDSLLEAYRTYLRLNNEEGEEAMNAEDETLYRSFLYCAIRYAERPPRWDPDFYLLPVVQGTYEDILWFARNLMPEGKADLLFYEAYRPQTLEGFFACMDEIYQKISGQSVVQAADEGDFLRMREVHQREIHELEKVEQDQESLRNRMGEEAWQEMLRQNFEEIAEGIEEMAEDAAEKAEEDTGQQQKQADWLAGFREPETFCSQYLLFRKIYFEVPSGRTLFREISCMLDTALLLRGDSRYLNDDFFFYALAMLEKAAGLLDRQVADGR